VNTKSDILFTTSCATHWCRHKIPGGQPLDITLCGQVSHVSRLPGHPRHHRALQWTTFSQHQVSSF